MKTPLLCLAASLFTAAFAGAAEEIAPGASAAEVRSALGIPRGRAVAADREVLYYDRGEVELQADRVIRVALRTPEEQAAMEVAEARQREERAARRTQLIETGTALRDQKLTDTAFANAPASYQVAFWEDLARRYPEVSVAEPLSLARLRYNKELAEQRQRAEQEQRIADLEAQLAEAQKSPQFYPVYTSPYHRRYRPYAYSPGLGPIRYDFYSSPLPPYSTPSGNPAGDFRGNPAGDFRGNPAGDFRGNPADVRGPIFNPPTHNPVTPIPREVWRSRDRFNPQGPDRIPRLKPQFDGS